MRSLLRADFDGVKVREVAKALPVSRQRYAQAIASIYDDEPLATVARQANVTEVTVRHWISAFNSGGLEAVFEVGSGGVYDLRKDYTGEDLRAAADVALTDAGKAKLLAIASMYDGEPSKEIARMFGVSPSKVAEWRREFNAEGLRHSHGKLVPTLQADLVANNRYHPPARVKARLESAKTEELVLRLKAILMSYGGRSIEVISAELKASRAAVSSWIKVFNAVGPNGLLAPDPRESVPRVVPDKAVKMPAAYSITAMREMAGVAETAAARDAFFALASLYEGHGFKSVAKLHRMKIGFVRKLKHTLEVGGTQAVHSIGRPKPKSAWVPVLPSGISFEEFEARARSHPNAGSRERLVGIVRLIQGEDISVIAAEHNVKEGTVKGWVRALHERGFDAFPETESGHFHRPVPDRPARMIEIEERRRAEALAKSQADREAARAEEALRLKAERAEELRRLRVAARAKGPAVAAGDASAMSQIKRELWKFRGYDDGKETPQRRRLHAVRDYLLYGRNRDAVNDVPTKDFDRWLARFEAEGLDSFSNSAHGHLVNDRIKASSIYSIADAQKNEERALEMRAIAFFHMGSSVQDIADDLGLRQDLVLQWLRQFHADGFTRFDIYLPARFNKSAANAATPSSALREDVAATQPPKSKRFFEAVSGIEPTSPESATAPLVPSTAKLSARAKLIVQRNLEIDARRDERRRTEAEQRDELNRLSADEAAEAEAAALRKREHNERRAAETVERVRKARERLMKDEDDARVRAERDAAKKIRDDRRATEAAERSAKAVKARARQALSLIEAELRASRQSSLYFPSPKRKRLEALASHFAAIARGIAPSIDENLPALLQRFASKGLKAFRNSDEGRVLTSGTTLLTFALEIDKRGEEASRAKLLAVAMCHAGSRISDVEEDLGMSPGSVRPLLLGFRRKGFDAFPLPKPQVAAKSDVVAKKREEMILMLKAELKDMERKKVAVDSPRFRRLSSIKAYLEGGRSASALGNVHKDRVRLWLDRLERNGIADFGNVNERHLGRGGLKGKRILAYAERHLNDEHHSNLRCIAYFHDGSKIADIEEDEGLRPGTLIEVLAKFRKDGFAAFKTAPARHVVAPSAANTPTPIRSPSTARKPARKAVVPTVQAQARPWFTPYPKYDRESLVRILNGTKDDAFAAALGSVILAHDGKQIGDIVKVVGASVPQIKGWVAAYSTEGIFGIAP